jgi:hypothetical protein
MPYIGRDANGNIVTVSTSANAAATEFMAADADELQRHLAMLSRGEAFDDLTRSDQELIRVVEDIIDTLIDKNIIRFTDLPEAAQRKLVHRRGLRRSNVALDLLGADESETIPPLKL